jgi:hypothetical protein
VIKIMEIIRKKQKTGVDDVDNTPRSSERLGTLKVSLQDKASDGEDERRERGTLKALTGYVGAVPYRGGVTPCMRSKINRRKMKCRNGTALCYDKLKDLGQAYYLYSLPVNVRHGLLQGFKTESAVKQFNKECKILQSHKGTNYMFLHWEKGKEASQGDWRTHPYVITRDDLATSIDSLGNFVSKHLLFPDGLLEKQPGGLSNNIHHKNKAQPAHFDVTGWQGLPAKQLPHVLHVPLCKEGMMLHIFPSKRDPATHHLGDRELMQVGEPVFVHIAFGDALLLRADVAHGGCYGSIGNFRFHMMLRVGGCPLETDRLLLLKTVAEKKSYRQALQQFIEMDPDKEFSDAQKKERSIMLQEPTFMH